MVAIGIGCAVRDREFREYFNLDLLNGRGMTGSYNQFSPAYHMSILALKGLFKMFTVEVDFVLFLSTDLTKVTSLADWRYNMLFYA